jgi:hypothetical protein
MKQQDPTRIVLILSNLVPLAGVLWLGWSAFDILALYWAECVIVSFYAILMIMMSGAYSDYRPANENELGAAGAVVLVMLISGTFLSVQFLGIMFFGVFAGDIRPHLAKKFFYIFFNERDLFLGAATTFAAYGVAFYRGFIRPQVYLHAVPSDPMGQVMKRILLMQFIVVGGGGITAFILNVIGFDERSMKGIMIGIMIISKNAVDHYRYKAEYGLKTVSAR